MDSIVHFAPVLVGGLITIVTVGMIAVAFGAVFWFIVKVRRKTARLLATGKPGRARVLSLRDTGVYVMGNPRIQLGLSVVPDDPSYRDGQPFETSTTCVVPRLRVASVQPGQVIDVRYDPDDPTQVALALAG